MRQIEVDFDVFAAIWSARRPAETTENEILRRILLNSDRLSASSTASSLGEGNISQGDQPFRTAKEVFTSKDVESERSEHWRGETMGKIRWIDDVRIALRDLGGRASLSRIYKEVEQRRRDGGRSVPISIEATIRRTIEDHSSNSDNFKGVHPGDRLDIFTNVGRGEWALR